MRSLLKIFLPYSIFLGIGLAVWVSNYHPMAEAIVIEPGAKGKQTSSAQQEQPGAVRHRDPICHMDVNPAWGWAVEYKGRTHYFCCRKCRDKFAASPEDYIGDRCLLCKKVNFYYSLVCFHNSFYFHSTSPLVITNYFKGFLQLLHSENSASFFL